MVRQHVLPFKLEATNDTMTSQSGLVLFGEFLRSLDIKREIDRAFGTPGSGAGYPASAYVIPLLLMLQGGGRSLEDLRMIVRDKGFLELLEIGEVPSTDAFGRWLRRMGKGFRAFGPGIGGRSCSGGGWQTSPEALPEGRNPTAPGGDPRHRRDPDRGGESPGLMDLQRGKRVHAPGGSCERTLRNGGA